MPKLAGVRRAAVTGRIDAVAGALRQATKAAGARHRACRRERMARKPIAMMRHIRLHALKVGID